MTSVACGKDFVIALGLTLKGAPQMEKTTQLKESQNNYDTINIAIKGKKRRGSVKK